ncbi:MAG TPA: hypothetical protein V6C50_11490, partial [Crinalium sp.]
NMLRNGSRAMALGPVRVGWYAWYCLLDQRLSFWTGLVTPTLMLIYLLQGKWLGFVLILCWIMFTRPLRMLVYQWQREAILQPIHVLQDLLGQWSSSLIKIYTQMNLAQQKWSNRGNQSRSAAGTGPKRWLKQGTSQFLLVAQGFAFVICLLYLVGYLSPYTDVQALWWRQQHSAAIEQPTKILQAANYGVKPDDNLDDAPALQKLLDELPTQGRIQINLPSGELILAQSLMLRRSHTTLKGQGPSRSILHLMTNESDAVAITATPRNGAQPLVAVKLASLTLLQDAAKGIPLVVRNANRTWLSHLQFRGSGMHALLLETVKNTRLEYLAFDGSFSQSPIARRNNPLDSKDSLVSSRSTELPL